MSPNFCNMQYLLKTTIFTLILSLFSCNSANINNKNNPQIATNNFNENLPSVVATNSILCDLTKQIAQDTINLICLIPTGINPINYKSVPEDTQTIENANLVLYHGYNFEPGLNKIIKSLKKSPPKLAVAQTAITNTIKIIKNNKQTVEPHVWHNPNNTIKMVKLINTKLIKTFPKNKDLYNRNTKKINQEINQLNKWIQIRLASIPERNRKLITAHKAMIYYVKAYDIPYQGNLANAKNSGKLTDTKVKTLVKDIQKAKVPTIFGDTTTNSNVLAPIATQAKVKVFERPLYIDGLGEPGSDGETYQKMMTANTRIIVEGLGGTYLKFESKSK
ncbi:MAG: metal ABC transporter solute-binding protein, Zn/Mn family [Cuspidothrix sp.]